jgi:hypothetical protein
MDFSTLKMGFFGSKNQTMDPELLNMTVAAWLPGLMAIGFLLFVCYAPSVKKGVPEFTKEKYPIIGSYRFIHKW